MYIAFVLFFQIINEMKCLQDKNIFQNGRLACPMFIEYREGNIRIW